MWDDDDKVFHTKFKEGQEPYGLKLGTGDNYRFYFVTFKGKEISYSGGRHGLCIETDNLETFEVKTLNKPHNIHGACLTFTVDGKLRRKDMYSEGRKDGDSV